MVKKLVKGCPFMELEAITEKEPNFQEILLNIWRSLSQNFNVIALFVLELFSRLPRQKVCEGVLL